MPNVVMFAQRVNKEDIRSTTYIDFFMMSLLLNLNNIYLSNKKKRVNSKQTRHFLTLS